MKKHLKTLVALFMTVTVLACMFTVFAATKDPVKSPTKVDPSIEPIIIDGKEYSGVIIDEKGNIIDKIPTDKPYVIVTPYNNRGVDNPAISSDLKDKISKDLLDAYNEFAKTEDIGKIISGLDSYSKKVNPQFNSWVYVVTDLFNITFSDILDGTDKYVADLERVGNKLKVTLKLGMNANDYKPAFLFKPIGSDKWNLVDGSLVTVNPDGTVTVCFEEIGSVAVLRTDAKRIKELGIESYKTFDNTPFYMVAFFALLTVAVYEFRRYKSEK